MSAPALPPSDPAPGRSPADGYADGSETAADHTRDLRAILLPLVRTLDESVEPDEDIAEAFASAVEAAGWRRVTEDPPAPREFVVFDMEPDDVVLIGGVKGGVQVAERLMQWARTEWPHRKILLFTDAIDVRLLREFVDDESTVLDDLADELDQRAEQRLTRSGDEGPCEDECEEVTCHTVAAAATWRRAAGLVRRRAAVLRGGAQ